MSATCKHLARIALAFALTSTMLSLPYRFPKTWDLLQFVRMALRMAMQEKALHASLPQAPYVSTASGMHCQPSSEHFVSFCSSILQLLQLHQQKSPLLEQFWDLAMKLL